MHLKPETKKLFYVHIHKVSSLKTSIIFCVQFLNGKFEEQHSFCVHKVGEGTALYIQYIQYVLSLKGLNNH